MWPHFTGIVFLTCLLTACGPEHISAVPQATVPATPPSALAAPQLKDTASMHDTIIPFVHTRFVYPDTGQQQWVIENSLPRGGFQVTDSYGQRWRYAIFWSRIYNGSTGDFTFSLDFGHDKRMIPAVPANYFRVVLPAVKMSITHSPQFNYGLSNIDSLIAQPRQQRTALRSVIPPGEAATFAVVVLLHRWVDGTVRAGLSLRGDELYYRVNEQVFAVGDYSAPAFSSSHLRPRPKSRKPLTVPNDTSRIK